MVLPGVDILVTQSVTSHTTAPGWNLMFADTRVEFKISEYVFESIPYSDGAALGHNWSVFANYMEDLEQQ